ncbi:MAG: SCO family protein, partial [Burkholderiales bacterium]
MHRRKIFALGLAALLAACGRAGPKFHYADITGVDWGHGFDLPDTSGKRRTLADFKGKVVMVFFGYTHCPDECPTTLSDFVRVRKALGDQADQVEFV